MALPVRSNTGKSKIPGIKIHDTRMLRIMEVLLHGSSQLNGWRTVEVWKAVAECFDLSPQTYILNQLRYDVRKMKGHGLLERVGGNMPTALPIRECVWLPCSSSSTSAVAAPWPTLCFTIGLPATPSLQQRSNSPTTKLTLPSSSLSTSSLRKKTRKSEREILRPGRLEAMNTEQ
jgi:hypothetical protein